MITETVTVGFCTKGGFTYRDVLDMDFKLFRQLMKDVEPIKQSYEKTDRDEQ